MKAIKITIIAIATLFAVACNKEELSIDNTSREKIEQYVFNEPATGIEHLLEIRSNDAELLVKSGVSDCYRPTREGDLINVELVFINTAKEGINVDLINNGNIKRIFIRIVGDIAEIPFNGVAIHAERAQRPWLIYKCN